MGIFQSPFVGLMPEPHQGRFLELVDSFEKNGDGLAWSIPAIREHISAIRPVLVNLKKEFVERIDIDVTDEILFFKVIKPHFHALLGFWQQVFDLELFRPQGEMKERERFLTEELSRTTEFFQRQAELYRYFQGGHTHLDSQYFLRSSFDDDLSDVRAFDLDHRYCSNKDDAFARMLGWDWYRAYLRRLLAGGLQDGDRPALSSTLQWTASKAGLVELVYALYATGVCNNGTAHVKELAVSLASVFQMELGNYYHTFNEIRLRKKSRTPLLDEMRARVTEKMDEMDVR